MILGDEGALGLMGIHIQRGARPIFYYGGYYLGAIDAYLAAASFSVFGPSLRSLRAVPSVLALTAIPLAYLVAKHLYGRLQGFLAATLVALPSKFVFEWGSKALIGFFSHVSLALLILYCSLRVLDRRTPGAVALLGLVAGLAIWNNMLALPYVMLCVAALRCWAHLRGRHAAIFLVAVVVGMSPLLYGNVILPLATPRALARKVYFSWNLAKHGKEHAETNKTPEYRAMPLLEVLGAQVSRDGRWSTAGAGGALFLVAGFLGAAVRCRRQWHDDRVDLRPHLLVLALALLSVCLGLGGVSGQPVGRYQLPLYALLSILTAGWAVQVAPTLALPTVALVAFVHAVAIATPPAATRLTSRNDIIQALRDRNLRYGYSAGPMYDLTFVSSESVILVPLDHSRYRPYEEMVAAAGDPFYLYRDDQESKSAHTALIGYLKSTGASYKTVRVGDYRVLHAFEPPGALSKSSVALIRTRFRSKR